MAEWVATDPKTGEVLFEHDGTKWIPVPKGTTPKGVGPPQEGPLGIVSPEFRQTVEEKMARRTGLERFAGHALPATVGTVVGGALGSLGGPAAPITIPLGASLGGLAGELAAQEVGLTPESGIGAGMAAAAPLVGPAMGVGTKLAGQGTRFGLRQVAPMRAAIARHILEDITQQTEKLGTKILSHQRGLMGVPQSYLRNIINNLDDTLRDTNQLLTRQDLKHTMGALNELESEITRRGLNEMPHGQQVLGLIGDVRSGIFPTKARPSTLDLARAGILPSEAPFPKPAGTSFDRYLSIRSEVGQAVRALEQQAGVKLGSAKTLFGSMAEDLRQVAAGSTGVKKRVALLSQKFLERSKLEFAVEDLEEIMSGAIKSLKGEGADVVVNAKGVLDKLRSLTDPKSANFDKNFTDALKNELPEIRKFFEEANRLGHLTPAGPGSLVIRQRFAMLGAGIGGGIGGTMFGAGGAALGAGSGAAMGARMPEYMVAALLKQPERKMLLFAMREGRGTINPQTWATVTQMLNQSMIASTREAKRKAEDFFGISGAREILRDKTASVTEKMQAAMEETR